MTSTRLLAYPIRLSIRVKAGPSGLKIRTLPGKAGAIGFEVGRLKGEICLIAYQTSLQDIPLFPSFGKGFHDEINLTAEKIRRLG